MNDKGVYACALALAVALTSEGARGQAPTPAKMIDDFVSGPLHQQMPAAWTAFYQASNDVLGGVRQTNLYSDDELGTSSRVDIADDLLVVSSGIGSYHGIFLMYGLDAAGNDGDMHADFTEYNRFRIDFEASDLGLAYLIEVWDGQGAFALLTGQRDTASQSEPFSADLAFGDFDGMDAAGQPQAIDWSDIHYLIVYFQSGSATGGNDFALRSIRAVDAPE